MRKGIPESLEAETAEMKSLVQYVSETAHPVYLTLEERPKAVIMDIDSYNALLDAIEGAEQQASVPESDLSFIRTLMQRYRSMQHQA